MGKRPPIPSEIKRIVRERCGYGCVICGAQPYDYDHIMEYEIVKRHEADNLTLLCKHHHGEKTLKNLTKKEIRKANASPHNLKLNFTKPRLLYYSGKSVEVHIGGSIFRYHDLPDGFKFVPIQIDGCDIISFTCANDKLLLSLNAFDRNNKKIVEINENEIVHSTDIWDAEWQANKLIIREANGRFLLRMLFQTPNIIKIDKGFFHYNNTDLILDDDALFIANNKSIMKKFTIDNCTIGLCVQGFGPYKDSWKNIKAEFRKAKKNQRSRLQSGV